MAVGQNHLVGIIVEIIDQHILDIPLAPGDEIVMGGLKPEEHLQDRDEEGEREYREEGRDDIEEHTQRERALIGGGESPDE